MAFVINYIFVLLIASTDMIQIKVLHFVFHFFNAFESKLLLYCTQPNIIVKRKRKKTFFLTFLLLVFY